MAEPPTNADLLALAQAAYATALTTGKSVTFGNRSFQPWELDALGAQITALTRLVTAETGSYFGAPRTRVAAYEKGV